MKNKIQKLARKYANEVIKDRRRLHANPELSFQEYNTSKFVAERLRAFGLKPQEGIAKTGVVAVIEGQGSDKIPNPKSQIRNVVALRADMDALPIQEANDVSYRSKNNGIMHACGHDVHTASLLGAARILCDLKSEFYGSIKLIFQPAEEKLPGGASLMIKEGVLKAPAPANIIGQHVMPLIPVGKVGFREGKYMASTDEIYITVKGKGGHAAMPEMNIDPVLIASHIIVALQQVISRNASPKIPSVLSFGRVIAEGATNVIPDEVKMEGTFRTMDEDWRTAAHKKIKQITCAIAEGMGGAADIDIRKGYPCLENHPQLTAQLRKFAEDYLGKENVVDLDIWMASEDFSYYSHQINACFYRLGVRNEAKGITSLVHTPTFNIDEDALEVSAGLMAWLAVSELSM